jgi:hypothetical protein
MLHPLHTTHYFYGFYEPVVVKSAHGNLYVVFGSKLIIITTDIFSSVQNLTHTAIYHHPQVPRFNVDNARLLVSRAT